MPATIKLNFFGNTNNTIIGYQLSFQNGIQFLKNESVTFNIPDNVFKYGKDKTLINIQLFGANLKEKKVHKFFVYYGDNKAYVQLKYLSDISYEIIFNGNHINKLNLSEKEFTELDTMGNNKLKRLILINYSDSYLFINNNGYNLLDIIRLNCTDVISNSYQLIELDYSKKEYIVKPIEDKKKFDVEFFKKKKDKILSFEGQLNILFKSNDEEYDLIKENIVNRFSDIINHETLYMNGSEEYLNELFNNNLFLNEELFYNYFLCNFFLKNGNDFNKTNRNVVKAFIDKINEFIIKLIFPLKNIEVYEKIKVINSLFLIYYDFKSIEEINSLKLKLVVVQNKESNSIIDKVMNFFENFIQGLDYNSLIFHNLLLLDSGFGYFKNEMVYTFDLTNLEKIKYHLKMILPKIIIFYHYECDEIAFTSPEFGGICINEFHLLTNISADLTYLDYNGNSLLFINEDIKDEIAMNIVIDMFHESFGHTKFSLSSNGIDSPKKIVNAQNKIIKLKYVGDFVENDNNSEYILTSNNQKGDSGHFFELCYGKYENILILKLLRDMKNKGKLIQRSDLFTDSINKLKEYVILRKILEKKNVFLNFDGIISIEQEIEAMKNIIKKKGNVIKIILGKKTKRDNFKDKKEMANLNTKGMKNKELKKENKKEKNGNYERKTVNELLDLLSKEEVFNIIKERVMKKYGFKFDPLFMRKVRGELKKLKPNSKDYQDILFLILQDQKRLKK